MVVRVQVDREFHIHGVAVNFLYRGKQLLHGRDEPEVEEELFERQVPGLLVFDAELPDAPVCLMVRPPDDIHVHARVHRRELV